MRLCSIASGSSGNCIYVGGETAHVLVDAGISGKRIECGLQSIDMSMRDMDGILVTHEHYDHVKGLGVLARRYKLPIYATKGTIAAICAMSQVGKLPEGIFREISEDADFWIQDLQIRPFTISHDAAQPVGYRLQCGSQSVGIATDLGTFNDYIVENLRRVNALLLEANHDVRMLQAGGYPYYLKCRILGDRGHLSNENAGRLLCRLLHDQLKAVLLGHLSQENNMEELAYQTVCQEVTLGENPYRAEDFQIQVAGRSRRSELITL